MFEGERVQTARTPQKRPHFLNATSNTKIFGNLQLDNRKCYTNNSPKLLQNFYQFTNIHQFLQKKNNLNLKCLTTKKVDKQKYFPLS